MKELIKSKTFWTGVASVLSGVAMFLGDNKDAGLQLIVTGLVAIFIRDGINKNSNKVS